MSKKAATATPAERARLSIIHSAKECETCTRLAKFANENGMSSGIAEGLRKFANFHSENAFAAARQLAVMA